MGPHSERDIDKKSCRRDRKEKEGLIYRSSPGKSEVMALTNTRGTETGWI